MNKRIVSLSILTIMFTIIAVFAMISAVNACNVDSRCNIVAASEKPGAILNAGLGELSTLKNGLVLDRGITFDTTGKLTIGSAVYDIYSVNTIDAVFNSKTGVVENRADAVWYIGSGTTVSSNGFTGNVETKRTGVTSFPPGSFNLAISQTTVHCVLQGFGSFAGQTLVLSYDQPTSVTTASWTGYDITHCDII